MLLVRRLKGKIHLKVKGDEKRKDASTMAKDHKFELLGLQVV